MTTTIRILQCRDPVDTDSRVFFIANPTPVVIDPNSHTNPSRFIVVCESLHKVPIDINRFALHEQYTDSCIEWQGDVSVKINRFTLGLYTITSTDIDVIIARMLRLWRPENENTYWHHPDVTPKAMVKNCVGIQEGAPYFSCNDADVSGGRPGQNANAQNHRHGTNDQRVWQICKIIGMTTVVEHGHYRGHNSMTKHTHADVPEFNKLMAAVEHWYVIASPTKEITGWKLDDVVAVHDPIYGAYLATPPMTLSFTTLDDGEPPKYVATADADNTKTESSSATASASVSTIDRMRQRIDELEARNVMFAEYIDSVADRLNPRLSVANRIKTSRELTDT